MYLCLNFEHNTKSKWISTYSGGVRRREGDGRDAVCAGWWVCQGERDETEQEGLTSEAGEEVRLQTA
jgi:hypothetical protein